jgi:hypothetical protein
VPVTPVTCPDGGELLDSVEVEWDEPEAMPTGTDDGPAGGDDPEPLEKMVDQVPAVEGHEPVGTGVGKPIEAWTG